MLGTGEVGGIDTLRASLTQPLTEWPLPRSFWPLFFQRLCNWSALSSYSGRPAESSTTLRVAGRSSSGGSPRSRSNG